MANVLTEATKKGFELHLCALDLSKAFETVTHSQSIFSLFSHSISISEIFLLRYWYSNSFLRIKTDMRGSDSKFQLRRGVRQGAVLSPSIFKLCISSVLSSIPPTCILNSVNISYLAYADDILLMSRTEKRLSLSVSTVASKPHAIGLSLNLSKCKYLSFNSNITTPLICGSFSIPSVSSFRWLGINVSKTLKSLRTLTVADYKKKIQLSYSKIVANRGRYNRKSLAKLYSVFTDHSVLFLSGIYPIFHKKISVQFVLIISGFPVFYCICLHGIGIGASYLFIVSRILGRSSRSLLAKYPSLLISICPPTEALLVCFSFLFFLFCEVFALFFFY